MRPFGKTLLTLQDGNGELPTSQPDDHMIDDEEDVTDGMTPQQVSEAVQKLMRARVN